MSINAGFTFYNLATGQIVGHYHGPAAWLSSNRPEGCGYVPGVHHHDSAEIDLATGTVVQRPLVHSLGAHILAAKQARDKLLAASDWVRLRANDLGQPMPDEWLAYRQALRDITNQPGWPLAVIWPTRPGE